MTEKPTIQQASEGGRLGETPAAPYPRTDRRSVDLLTCAQIRVWLVSETSLSSRFDRELPTGGQKRGAFIRAAHSLVHVYRCLRRDFGMNPISEDAFSGWLNTWATLEEESRLAPRLKWGFAGLFSKITGQPLPPAPEPGLTLGVLFPGRVRVFVRTLVASRRVSLLRKPTCRSALRDAQTIANLKKGTAVVSKELQEKTLRKHEAALADTNGWIRETPDLHRVIDEARRLVREVFHGTSMKEYLGDRPAPFPSFRGHYQFRSDRGKRPTPCGGAAGLVMSLWNRSTQGLRTFSDRILLSKYGNYRNQRSAMAGERFSRSLMDRVMEEAMGPPSQRMRCRPVAVCEPLKVRVVTAGPEATYWVIKPLQEFMWKTLRSHRTFRLIGEVANGPLLDEVLGPCGDGEVYVSGDYKAATDNLRPRLSWAIADEICRVCQIPRFLARLFKLSLVGHCLDYGRGAGLRETGRVRRQLNGQLMGSPVSFPVLCLANAAICRLALVGGSPWERPPDPRPWGDLADEEMEFPPSLSVTRDCPLLVNGDDCVFRCGPSVFPVWERLAAAAGMEPSVGKTYCSGKWLQINSQVFRTTPSGFEKVPYRNWGFCSVFAPKSGKIRTFLDLPALQEDFLEGTPEEGREQATRWFIQDHRVTLETCPPGVSYWMPRHLGGVGLRAYRPLRMGPAHEVSYRQVQLAEYLRRSRRTLQFSELTTGGSTMRSIPTWVIRGTREVARARVTRRPGGDTGGSASALFWAAGRQDADSVSARPGPRGNWRQRSRQSVGTAVSEQSIGSILLDEPRVAVLPEGFSRLCEERELVPRGVLSSFWGSRDFGDEASTVDGERRLLPAGPCCDWQVKVEDFGLSVPMRHWV